MVRLTNAARYVKYGRTSAAVQKQLVWTTLFGKSVQVHRRVLPRFLAWETRVRVYEAENRIKPWRPDSVQTFNWRLMRGSRNRSMHSWGIAADFDPPHNPMGTHKTNIPLYVRNRAKLSGFTVGYDWRNPDPMHFEYPY
jgi:hypothetical protein